MRLKGQAVVVTGGGGGIGGVIARAFAAEGAGLIVGDRDDRAASVAAAIRAEGGRAVAARADVTRTRDMSALAALAEREHGRLNVLVTCAGLGVSGLLAEQEESENGVIGLTRALAAELGSQGFPGITVNAVCPGYTRAGMGIAVQSTKSGPRSGEEIAHFVMS